MEQAVTKKKISGTPRLKFPIKAPIAFCQGCQHPFMIRVLSEIVDELKIEDDTIILPGIGCHSIIGGLMNLDAFMPTVAHGRAPDVATGMKRILGKKSVLINIQGDGDAMAIGTESLIQAAARGERITVLMLNNQVYGTTGGQCAPTTIFGFETSTTREGRKPEDGYPIRTAELLARMGGVVYSARGSFTSIANYKRTKKYVKTAVKKQMDDQGLSFVEILSACPTAWRLSPEKCIEFINDELIQYFPLGEFKNVG